MRNIFLLKVYQKINAIPVPYKWKYKMETINLEEENIGNIVYEVVNVKAASSENQGKHAPATRKRKSK